MTTFTEGRHTAEFIISEANGNRSRENGTVVSGQTLVAGQVVAKIVGGANDGKLTAYVPGAEDTDGPVPAEGIVLGAVDASSGDVDAAYLARDAVVSAKLIAFGAEDTDGVERTNTVTALKALNIIAR